MSKECLIRQPMPQPVFPLENRKRHDIPCRTHEQGQSQDTALVLLCAATGGLYLLIWLYKTNQHLREATGQTVCSETYIIWICVCMGLSGVFIDNPEPFRSASAPC